MSLSITTSCTPHTVYKTKTEYVTFSKDLLQECKVVPVQEGAKTKDDLLKLLSIAYTDTLKNVKACNIKTKQASMLNDKYIAKESPSQNK